MEHSPYLHYECLSVLMTGTAWYLDPRQGLPRLDDARACLALLARADQQIQTSETHAALAEARGLLALAEGAPGPGAAHLRDAAAGWAATSRPLDQARALSSLGRAQPAPELFQQAMAIIRALAEQIDDSELRASFLSQY